MNKETDSNTTAGILRALLTQKMARNPAFSLRAFARDLGVSHTYLSLVLNGKKPLSMKKAVHFSNILKLDARAAAAFLAAATKERQGAGDPGDAQGTGRRKRRDARAELVYFELETDRFRILEDWYHLPLLELTLMKGFRNDPPWIAKKLGISVSQVQDAVDRLKRLGLLEERDGTLVKTHARVTIMPKRPDRTVRNYHRNMITKALDALESGDEADLERRDVTGVTLPADPSRIPEAKRRIAKFRRSLWKFLSEGECSELYQFNLQLFPLTVEPGKRSGVRGGEVLKRGRR